MSPREASGKPHPYQSRNLDILHTGRVIVDGSQLVDLGLRHNNFDVYLSVKHVPPVGAPNRIIEWDYGSKLGTFLITAGWAYKFAGEQQINVVLATAAALPAYTQAGAGPNATLTADAVGILTVDGTAVVANDIILVKDGAAGSDNGIYKCTTEGTAGVAFILTREVTHDADAEVTQGDYTHCTGGRVNANKGFVCTTAVITVDTHDPGWTVFDDVPEVGFLVIDNGAV